MAELVRGQAYLLSGMTPAMWQNCHAEFGQPQRIVAVYMGAVSGTRTWHLFEVQFRGRDEGVLLMNADDLAQLRIEAV